MKRLIFAAFFLILCCVKTDVVTPPKIPELNLVLLDSLRLTNPVSGLGLDTDGGVLLIEISGAKIIKLSSNLIKLDSIMLPQRLFYPKGIRADEFFIYIYTENSFYRFDRQKKTLKQIYSGIKSKGMIVINTNEVYLSDPQNNRIIMVDATGNVKDFIKQPEKLEPADLVYDAKNGTIWLINNRSQAIEGYNRIGNLKASIAVFNLNFQNIALAKDNSLFLIGKNGSTIWRIDKKGQFRLYQATKDISFVATDLLLGNDRIYILDYQNRILSFPTPQ